MSSKVAGIVQIIRASIDTATTHHKNNISPIPVPLGAQFPYITVQEILNKEYESLTGPSDLSRSIMQVNCWDKNYEVADELRTSIKDILLQFQGSILDLTVAAVNHSTDAALYDPERQAHQLVSRFVVQWER